jgi:hypothetical protein
MLCSIVLPSIAGSLQLLLEQMDDLLVYRAFFQTVIRYYLTCTLLSSGKPFCREDFILASCLERN